ncbi:MAG: heme exporter protein CcmD [Woeseia sp.]
MSEVLSMGGYGAYVWTCYALSFTVVIVCFVQGRRRQRRIQDEIRTRLKVTVPGALTMTESSETNE